MIQDMNSQIQTTMSTNSQSIIKTIVMLLAIAIPCMLYAQTPISWISPINVSVNGDNSLTKSGGTTATWDATIVSQNVLLSGQNGSIQFVYQPGTSRYMISLSKLNNNVNYAVSDFSVYVNGSTVRTYNLAAGNTPVAVSAGSTIKISREANQINIYVNSTVIRTFLASTLDYLRADVSLATGSAPVVTASFPPALMLKPELHDPFPGNNNGAITVTPEGQVNPITYSWSSSETTASISNKARGSYTVTATDATSRIITKTYGLGYPASWTNQTQVTVNSDNTITKTGTDGWGTSGAFSNNLLFPNTDGWIEFVVTDASSDYMIGFSRLDMDQHYNTIEYGWLIASNGTCRVFEGPDVKVTAIGIMRGDVFRVSREAGVIKYYLNGVLKRSVAGKPEYTYNVDLAIGTNMGPVPAVTTSFSAPMILRPSFQFPGLANNNGSISLQTTGQIAPVTYSWSSTESTTSITGKARGSYTVTATDATSLPVSKTYNLGYPIIWSNLSQVTVAPDNSLTKTGATGWGASGASSLNRLAANTDGSVEFVVNDVSSNYMIGLSLVDRDTDYTTITFAFYLSTNISKIYENGAAVDNTTLGVVKGDVFRISREGAHLKYYVNGALKRDRAVATTYSLIVDVALNAGSTPVASTSFDKAISAVPTITLPDNSNQNGSIALNIQGTYPPHSVSWSSGETTGIITGKQRGTYTVTITDAASRTFTRSYHLGYPTEWTDLKNAAVNSNNVVYKAVGDGNGIWDAGGISTNSLPASTDGWVEYVPPISTSAAIIGLSRLNSDANLTSIEYGFYAVNGQVNIYESGTNRGVFGNQSDGTVLMISREGSNIKYYINGVVVRTIATNATYQLMVDCSIYSGSAAMVTASFIRAPHTFYSIANGNWITPSVWSFEENGTPTTLYPGNSDLVVVKGYNILVNSSVNAAGVSIIQNSENTCLTVEGFLGLLNVTGGNITIQQENNAQSTNAIVVRNDARVIVN